MAPAPFNLEDPNKGYFANFQQLKKNHINKNFKQTRGSNEKIYKIFWAFFFSYKNKFRYS